MPVRAVSSPRPLKVAAPARAAAPASRPAAARKPEPRVPLAATERMPAERPSFGSPDEYKNYVIKFSGYIKAAKADLERAERELAALKASQAAREAEVQRALEAAKRTHEETHRLYQAPIDRLQGELAGANGELQDAIYPGRRKAAELDGLAEQLGRQIGELDRQLASARGRFQSLDGWTAEAEVRRDQARATQADAERELRQLEGRIPAGSSIERVVADARRELDVAAHELEAARDALGRLQEADRRRLSGLEGDYTRLEAEARRLTSQVDDARGQLATADARIGAELARRGQAETAKRDAEAEIRRLEPQASSSALAAQRGVVDRVKGALGAAESRVSTASARVQRAAELSKAVDLLASIKSEYDSAVDSRSSYKGHLTRKQRELDEAMATGDSARITAAKAAHDEMLAKYGTADQKVKALAGRMSSYGASRDTLDAVIGSKRSELAGLSGAEGELSRARGDRDAARAEHDREKAKLDQMQGLVDALNRAIASRDDAGRAIDRANVAIATITAEKTQLAGSLPGLEGRQRNAVRDRDAAESALDTERTRQAMSGHLGSEKGRVSRAESSHARARAAHDDATALERAIRAQRDRRDGARRTAGESDAAIEQYRREKVQLPTTMAQLQAQLDTKTRDRGATIAEANRERDRQNPATHPQVVAARRRVNDLQGQLEAARQTYGARIAGPKAALDEAQRAHAARMSEIQASLRDGEAGAAKARQGVKDVQAEFERLKTDVGWWQRTWWKLWQHFDVDDFWRSQQTQALAAALRQATGPAVA